MLWNLLLTGFRKIVKLLYSSLDEYEGAGRGGGVAGAARRRKGNFEASN